MATNAAIPSPATETDPAGARPSPSLETPSKQQVPEPSPLPPPPPSTPHTPSYKDSRQNPARAPQPHSDLIHIPSYSRWFSWDRIHDCEVRFLPEFFDSRSPSKNPRVYVYYRNSIIRRFRERFSQNPSIKITFTEARKTLVGDVGSIRRVFDFLEAWGLINYAAPAVKQPLKWEDKDNKLQSSGEPKIPVKETAQRFCSGCKSVCTIACFACDKYDLTLCARCYVRGNYQVGLNSTDFRRVEISEVIKSEWTEKETLHLLEAVLHYGDDWRKIAEHVGGRSEKECVARFIRLPFLEQFMGPPGSMGLENKLANMNGQNGSKTGLESTDTALPMKKPRLTPLADTSNPIMAQAAFLSALVGVEVAEAASQAAVTALSEVDFKASKERSVSVTNGSHVISDDNHGASTSGFIEAQAQIEKEENDVERAISSIVDVQMKEILKKIVHFEELELGMGKERQQLEQMRNLYFVDLLTLAFHKDPTSLIGESPEGKTVKISELLS
ncbi:SANT/Myb domain [Dillenia turbinata]|uniref:SANT/Myb domain n=1 Tax=Dillenia turbinata TaxID=194707 RepID=A0AAN8VQ48_9MAGN